MSEKENKFILGDNSDGYRRNSDETQPIVLPDRPVRRAQPAPQRKNNASRTRLPADRNRKKPATVQPSKNARHRAGGTASSAKKKVSADNAVLSPNERRKIHNEQRRKQRRRKQLLTYAAVFVAVIAAAAVLSLTVFFQINEFVIKGTSPYTDEQIIDACGLNMGENIIRCDADSVSGKLAEALPYIGSASVERSVSGKVTITIKTTSPYWSVINGEQAVLIDVTGKVLEVASAERALEATIVQGVIVEEAVPGQTVVLSQEISFGFLDSMGDAILSAGIDKLTSLNLSDIDYMQALYDGRINIVIGNSDDLRMKLALASEVIKRENEIDPAQYGTIDLTIDDRAYFRPQEEDAPYSENKENLADNTDNDILDIDAVA